MCQGLCYVLSACSTRSTKLIYMYIELLINYILSVVYPSHLGYEESCTLPEGLNNLLEDVEAYVSRIVHQTQLSNLRVGVINSRKERKNERVECVRAQPVQTV